MKSLGTRVRHAVSQRELWLLLRESRRRQRNQEFLEEYSGELWRVRVAGWVRVSRRVGYPWWRNR
jgi:hypothetical protein